MDSSAIILISCFILARPARSFPGLAQCVVDSNSSQAELRQWGQSICHLMDIGAKQTGLPGWGAVSGGGGGNEITSLLYDEGKTNSHPREGGSVFSQR